MKLQRVTGGNAVMAMAVRNRRSVPWLLRLRAVLFARRWVVAYSEFLPPLVAVEWTLDLWRLSFLIAAELERCESDDAA